MKKTSFEFQPIGHLKSCFIDRFGTPRQPHLVPHSRASLKINANLSPQAIAEGLEQFTHVWLIWVFHQNTNKLVKPKVHPPRLAGESVGVFASRTPHRPNPIGLSLVKLERIEGDTLYFCEVDLIDGTPVLDVKPYVRDSDMRTDVRDGWASQVPWTLWNVEFKPETREFLKHHAAQIPVPVNDIEHLIMEVLAQDPRPLVYKGDQDDPSPYREDYWVYLYNLNIRFRYGASGISVEEIEFRKENRQNNHLKKSKPKV